MQLFNLKYLKIGTTLLVAILYFILGYYFNRTQFSMLFFSYLVAFGGFIFLIKYVNNYSQLFVIGIFFRLIFIFSTPFLSQDFYRFIWDGRLIISHINPYDYLPNEIIHSVANFIDAPFLYEKMGTLSASHYSNYPPINQLIFALTALIFGKSVFWSMVFFRLIILIADIGIYYYGRKLLLYFNQNPNKIFWYFLNPLVLIELTGNLHFEGVMLFFLVLGFYNLVVKKWLLAAIFIAISISTKLLPLLLLPLFWQLLGIKKSIYFYSSILLLNGIFFLPFLSSNLIGNFTQTISLWFINFEFNASIYYVLREIGFYINGYNSIGIIGKITPIITILIILFFAFFKQIKTVEQLISNSLIVLTIYFFISTTVHPWYIINLVLLSVFTRFKFPIIWSSVIIVSYYAYSVIPFKENFWLLLIEYSIVYGCLLLELNFKTLKFINDGK